MSEVLRLPQSEVCLRQVKLSLIVKFFATQKGWKKIKANRTDFNASVIGIF